MNDSAATTSFQKPATFAWIMAAGVLSGWGYWFVSFVTGFIRVRILLSFLNEVEAGIWFLLLNFLGYITLLDFGVGVTLARNISFAIGGKFPQNWIVGQERQHFSKQKVVTADLIASVARLYQIFSLVGVSTIGGLGIFFFPLVVHQPWSIELSITWLLILVAGGLSILTITPSATLLGQQKLHYQQMVSGITRILGFTLTIIVLYLGLGIVGVAFAVMFEYLIRWILCWWLVRKLNPFLKSEIRGCVQTPLVKSLIGPSLRMGLITTASTLILQTDNLIISLHLGPEKITPYAIAFQLTQILLSVALTFPAPMVALSAQAFAENATERLKTMLGNSLKYTLSFLVLGAGILFFSSEEIIDIWVGSGYFVGTSLMMLLLLVMLLEAHTIVHLRLITASDQIPFTPWYIVAGILNMVISYWLVGLWGWHGVVVGTIISQGLTVYWYVPYFTQRYLSIGFKEYLTWLVKPVIGLIFVVLSLGTLTIWGLSYLPGLLEMPFLRLVISSMSIAILGFTWFLFKGMSIYERKSLVSLLVGLQILSRLRQVFDHSSST